MGGTRGWIMSVMETVIEFKRLQTDRRTSALIESTLQTDIDSALLRYKYFGWHARPDNVSDGETVIKRIQSTFLHDLIQKPPG